MSDYISREATLECFGDVPMWTGYNEPYSFEVHMALTGIAKVIHDTIAQVPAADVEPVRRGRWEFLGPNRLTGDGCLCGTCSVCKKRCKYIVNSMLCPNCGAKMDLEDE